MTDEELEAADHNRMTDIVERLRSYAHPNSWTASISEMLNEAADEIARLTRERDEARALSQTTVKP